MTINNSNIASYFRKFKRLAYSKNADEKELKEMMKNLIEYYEEKFGVSDENAYSMLFQIYAFDLRHGLSIEYLNIIAIVIVFSPE